MINIVTNRNCVYQTAYHVIWCPKYRNSILEKDVAVELGSVLDEICATNKWQMITKEIQPDHIHWFVSIPPSIAVCDVIKVLKGTSARKLYLKFPVLHKTVWGGHLWSPSYYVATAGNISAETVKKYIERSYHVTKRR